MIPGFTPGPGLAAGAGGARFWRFLANTAPPGSYWDLRTTAGGQAGVFESLNLSGTNIAQPLAHPGSLSFRNANGSLNTYGTGQEENIFAGAGELTSAISFPSGNYLLMDFGQPRVIGSVSWRSPSGFQRDIANMTLQFSNDNAAWVTFATLTNTGYIATPFWRNITQGSTVAATSS